MFYKEIYNFENLQNIFGAFSLNEFEFIVSEINEFEFEFIVSEINEFEFEFIVWKINEFEFEFAVLKMSLSLQNEFEFGTPQTLLRIASKPSRGPKRRSIVCPEQ